MPHQDDSLPVAPDTEPAQAQFPTLDALYDALRRQDAPMPGFGDVLVPGRGAVDASLFLIGEQPGDQEDRLGATFVGPAGKLLEQCIAQAGIPLSGLFLTNAVKRFKFVQRGKRRLHQRPNAGEVKHYRWWLGQEIALVDPATVVALGSTALYALTGLRRPVGELRAHLWDWNGRRLVVTVHPSSLLRRHAASDYAEKRAELVADLRRARGG